MSKKYRIFALFLILIMLAGCGGSAPAPTPAPAPGGDTPEGSAAVEEVVIGVLAPLTGPAAQFGVAVYNGIHLFINDFNARGGLQIRTIVYDEEGVATNAIIGYHSLVDQGITALIGSVTSTPTLAVVPEAEQDNMPMITATATHAAVTYDAERGHVFRNMFRSCFIDPFQGVKMAEFAAEIVGANTAAILFNNEDDYSIGLMESFLAKAIELGIDVVAVEQFGNATVDFLGQLTNIAAANPDVLFVPAYYEDIALIGPQSAAAGVDAVFLGADGWDGTLNIIADPSSIEGAFFLTGFTVEDESPLVQQFISNFYATYGEQPNMFAAQAYDAAMILIDAIQLALADGYLPNTDEFKSSVIGHMAATNMQAVTGHISFDEFNNPQKTAFIIQVVDGEARFWGTF